MADCIDRLYCKEEIGAENEYFTEVENRYIMGVGEVSIDSIHNTCGSVLLKCLSQAIMVFYVLKRIKITGKIIAG